VATGVEPGRRTSILLFCGGLGSWLVLIGAQALVGPFDGYVPIHVGEPGALVAAGPTLARSVLSLARPHLASGAVGVCYSLLLVVVPLFNIWLIGRILGRGGVRGGLTRHGLGIAAIVLLAVLTQFNLPYLSNDIYLYRTQGLMLSGTDCSPYAVTPAACLPEQDLLNVPWVHQFSPYGPLALAAFAAVNALAGGIVAEFWLLKALLTLPWMVMLIHLSCSKLYEGDWKPAWLVWIGLNPLLVLEVCQNAHLEGWIGLALYVLVIVLAQVSYARVTLAGLVFGLACAIKLSLVVTAPIVLVWIFTSARDDRSPPRETATLPVLFVISMLAALAASYWPLWQGAQTFAGIQQESAKVLRSLYSVLGHHLGVSAPWIRWLSFCGHICAGMVGMVVCYRRRSLVAGLIAGLLIQAVLGRTFLQPWHFAPAIMLAPLLGALPVKDHGDEVGRRVLRLLLVLSASALAGGYAVLFLAHGKSPLVQSLSFLVMVVPPLVAWSAGAWFARLRPGSSASSERRP